jgi:peptidoglycan hydrolase CwlO-like protein
MGVYNDKISKF